MLAYRIATAHRVITFFNNRVRWKIIGYLVCFFVPSKDFCSIRISLNESTSLRSDILLSCQASVVRTQARSSFVSLIDSDKLSRVGNDHENTDATFIADLSSSRYRSDEPARMNFVRVKKTANMLNIKRREERKRTRRGILR